MGEAMNELSFVHRWEPGTDAKAPTLLLLHGTGGSEHDLIDLGHSLAPGAGLLSPRGKISENGLARFFRRLAEGVFDLEDLKLQTAALAAFVETAAQVYGFDPRRVVALGYSNGANIAASLLLSGFPTLAGAALLHPMVPFEPAPVPKLGGISVLVTAGRQDPMVPETLTNRLVELLTAGGAAVETHWQPGGHNLTRAELEFVHTWMNQGDQPWN
jgi:predicted esterase